MHRSIYVLVALGVLAGACRPDIGEPQFPERPEFTQFQDPNFLPGVSPVSGEQERLSFGLFYEGPAVEDSPLVDDVVRFYNIYEQEYAPFAATYEQDVSDDRIEGFTSNQLTMAPAPPAWFGGGINAVQGEGTDLSGWETMHVALKSDDAYFENMVIRMSGVSVPVSTYGFVADGRWHGLEIPLSDFTNVDLSNVSSLFEVGSPKGVENQGGETLLVDDLYLSRAAEAE